jgi:hypothetical protein
LLDATAPIGPGPASSHATIVQAVLWVTHAFLTGETSMTAAMTRKAFCGALAGSTVALLFQGCGGGGGDAGAPAPAPGAAECTDTIAANHGHTLVIAKVDLDSATDKVYNIQGAADHNHTVTLTVAQLRTLKAGTSLGVTTSTANAHDHSVTILCM